MKRGWGLWLSVVVAAALFAGSAAAAYRELRPYIAGGSDPQVRLSVLSASPPDPAMSLQAQRLVLDDCVGALMPLIGTTLNEQTVRVGNNCKTLATEMVQEAPLFSYAWLALALAEALDGPTEAFQQALSQSQLTTANQWTMASLRLTLAYPFWNSLSPALQTQLGADMIVLAHSRPGRQWLAQRYAQDPDFREDIASNIEKAPPNLQRAFISAVAAQGAGS